MIALRARIYANEHLIRSKDLYRCINSPQFQEGIWNSARVQIRGKDGGRRRRRRPLALKGGRAARRRKAKPAASAAAALCIAPAALLRVRAAAATRADDNKMGHEQNESCCAKKYSRPTCSPLPVYFLRSSGITLRLGLVAYRLEKHHPNLIIMSGRASCAA